MHRISRTMGLSVAVLLAGTVSACAPEVGSPKWCEQMQAQPKADWTINEAADFARHCVFQ